jgi:hypothetical protein
MSLPGAAGAGPAAGQAPAAGDEIRFVFPSQWAAAQEILTVAEQAASVDILALRGSEIVGLTGPLLRAAAVVAGGAVRVRVLLLDPRCDAAAGRAAELGENTESFTEGIRQAEQELQSLAAQAPGLQVAVYYYSMIPVWRMIIIDQVQYVSTLCAGWEGTEAVVYKLADSPHGALYPGFRQLFESFLAGASQVL